MRAAILTAPGPVENFDVRDVPLPDVKEDWVRIRVKATGINRSDLHLRLGLAENVRSWPLIPGIEATGVIDLDPSGLFETGQQVVTMVGGMGRAYDGGYAEYVVVPRDQVVPFRSGLPWTTLGAIPETLQTAYGVLEVLELRKDQTLLVRGGTSALGYALAALAQERGATVLGTTRQKTRLEDLRARGITPLLDDGDIAAQIDRVDAAVELVGTLTLRDTLRATRPRGTVCFAGMLANVWTIPDFYPIDYLGDGVRLTGYSGSAANLPAPVLQGFLDRVAAGEIDLGPVTVYPLAEVRRAHLDLEKNTVSGKLVLEM